MWVQTLLLQIWLKPYLCSGFYCGATQPLNRWSVYMEHGFSRANLPADLRSGLVVFLVALPLCLGISMASGAPLLSGLITGIVGGLVVAWLSGSELSVSGPAAGLTVIIGTSITTLGSFQAMLLAIVLAGVMQLVMGYVKAGVIAYFFPSSVIKGMLAAIGLLLILKQIPHAFGYHADYLGNQSYQQSGGDNTFSALFLFVYHIQPGATLITIISMVVMLLWEQPLFQRYAFFRMVPSALLVVILGVLINLSFKAILPGMFLQGSDFLVALPLIESPVQFFKQFSLPNWSFLSDGRVYLTAATIAVVASMETLLSLEAADKLDPYKRKSSANRELKAQGVGNIICGLLGGLPMTAVIVRSSANINSGAKSRFSAFVHGILLLLSVLFLSKVLNLIPYASLAAILIMVGYKLTRISLFKGMLKLGWPQFVPFVVTVAAILFTDLLKGIAVGMAVSIIYILLNNYKRSYYFHREAHLKGEKIYIRLAEEVTFLNKASIMLTLSHLPENSSVVIDGSRSNNIDYDVLEIIQEFKTTAELKHIQLELIDIPSVQTIGGH